MYRAVSILLLLCLFGLKCRMEVPKCGCQSGLVWVEMMQDGVWIPIYVGETERLANVEIPDGSLLIRTKCIDLYGQSSAWVYGFGDGSCQ